MHGRARAQNYICALTEKKSKTLLCLLFHHDVITDSSDKANLLAAHFAENFTFPLIRLTSPSMPYDNKSNSKYIFSYMCGRQSFE